MRVCIAHDYLTQRGGAERVALALLRAFPGSPLVTSVYEPDRTFPDFAAHTIRTTELQAIGSFRRDPRLALPLLASAWSRTRVSDADVVVASSSGWAHGVGTDPGVRKVVYCHNPARWLYQPDDYAGGSRLQRAALGPLRSPLTRWDTKAARSADRYVVNSSVVAERVRRTYGIEAEVVPPPVAVDPQGRQEPVPGVQPGFLLTVARGRAYKNTAVIEQAVAGLPDERLVVVGAGAMAGEADPAVTRLGVVPDAQLRWLYAHARALVSVSFEDFGLTPIEANAFGTPAVLLRAGGFLDTLVEGVNGVFVDTPTVASVREAIKALPSLDPSAIRRHAAGYSEAVFRTRMQRVLTEVTGGRVESGGGQAASVDLRDAGAPIDQRLAG